MADNTIEINAKIQGQTDEEVELKSDLNALRMAIGRISPEFRKLGMTFMALTRLGARFGDSMKSAAAIGAACAAASLVIKTFADAVQQAADTLQDFAKFGNDMINEQQKGIAKQLGEKGGKLTP